MTQLTEQLYSTIVHDFHNGGVKSSYGLNAYTRKALLRSLLSSKACECINCLCDTDNTAQQGVSLDNVSPIRYNSYYNQLTKEEQTMTITYSLWDGAQLLGAGFTANSADEMNKVVADLQKVSKNVVAHMRKVEQN